MKIGTLSSELKGSTMGLSGKDRVAAIERVLRKHGPDLLLTAGYSLQDGGDLDELGRQLTRMDWQGLVVVEVTDWRGEPPVATGAIKPDFKISTPCLFAWMPGEGWRNLGRQFLSTSGQADTEPDLIESLAADLPRRTVDYRGKRIGTLICGEINALRYQRKKDEVEPRTPALGTWLACLDVLLHPTHDRMSDRGTLTAKRQWLSRDGRVYVHASNWNTEKQQTSKKVGKRTIAQGRTSLLHSVFRNGQALPMALVSDPNIEYREVEL